MNEFQRYVLGALVVLTVVLGSASAPALATDPTTADGDASDSHEIDVTDLTVSITDVHLTGPGFPELAIDDATYTVEDATVATDGATVTIDGREHRIGAIELTVDDVGLHLENVSIEPETNG
ncbi:hypothetical protein [Haloprofundus halobius]|uniref:hypothetical protein n=1 Tax=Haloprofundus halobius TaxID=2876194 RepID=UPI001CCFBDBD|nr:hypothetical protein [Haloprofundus halobius]